MQNYTRLLLAIPLAIAVSSIYCTTSNDGGAQGQAADLSGAAGRWQTKLVNGPSGSGFQFISPAGTPSVLRGISLTGFETGTRETNAGGGFWLFESGASAPLAEATNAPKIIQNVVGALTDKWHANIIRIPICGSAWVQNYRVSDWGDGLVATYRDWVDVAVKQARSHGATVILDNHTWAIGKISKGGTDRGTFQSNGVTQHYSDYADGCSGTATTDVNGVQVTSCAPQDFFVGDPSKWECPQSNSDGVTIHNAYKNKDTISSMWSQIATRYKVDSGVWFELYNEPYAQKQTSHFPANGDDIDESEYPWDLWTAFMQAQITKIRAVTDNVVIVNGFDWGYDFGPKYGPIAHPDKYLPWRGTPNIAYAFHPYQSAACCGAIGTTTDLSATDPYESGFCSFYPGPNAPWFGSASNAALPIAGGVCNDPGWGAQPDKRMPPCTWVPTAMNPITGTLGLCAGNHDVCNPKSESACKATDPASPAAGGWSEYVLPMQKYGPLIATEFGSLDCSSPFVNRLLGYMQKFGISSTAWAAFPDNGGGAGNPGLCSYPSVVTPSATDFSTCVDTNKCNALMQPLPWAGLATHKAMGSSADAGAHP